ncbi:hypothetical protein V6N11_045977 [Hibiscus sabdariffa]|uniref:Carbohydrate kinase PfkB domain-containing protein n=1 Tax=Hibiscus sabdariffa TaxID=183260 RepID=A0ABR2Q2L7_9ROSI
MSPSPPGESRATKRDAMHHGSSTTLHITLNMSQVFEQNQRTVISPPLPNEPTKCRKLYRSLHNTTIQAVEGTDISQQPILQRQGHELINFTWREQPRLIRTCSWVPSNGKALPVDGLPEIKDSSLVVCFGEMLIDFVPTISGLSLADAPAFKKAPGGAPANVAVGIARLGGSSAFIGKVAFVTLRSDGEREFMFYRNPSADMLLQENELDFDLITKATIFHYGSISLITEPCKSAHIAAAKAAKDAGVVLSYDPNLRLPLWPSAESAREGIMSIWDTADIIKVSEDEISFLTQGEDPYDDAVVQGPNGCRYYTQEFSGRVKGLMVEAVDTTGAGDAFVAGTLSQLASDLSLLQDEDRLRDALRFSNVCGALTVTERGAIPALPTREAVLDAILKTVA